jgi:hypothetical protein
MTTRAKLKLIEDTSSSWQKGQPAQRTLKFTAVYDASIPEDQRFQKATPSASATFLIDNPAALAQFELGDDYYFDISPVTPAPAPSR